MEKLDKKRIAILPWPGMENCFLCLSGALKRKTQYGEKWYTNIHEEHTQRFICSNTVEARISFAYREKNVAAEWDGEYGPIQIWYKCDKDYKEGYDEAREHWLFDYAYGTGHWSQIAVEENHLAQSFNEGDYAHIFSVIRRFVRDRENDNVE